MKKILNYSLSFAGLLLMIFCITYKGNVLPFKPLFFILSLVIIGFGFYNIIKQKFKEQYRDNINTERLDQIRILKLSGEKIKITLDNAEVKTRTYQTEIIDDSFPGRTSMLDGLYNPNAKIPTLEVQQTYIVYYKKYGEQTHKFISPATSLDNYKLRKIIDIDNNIFLYVDKNNPKNYYFDFYPE